MWFDDEEYSFDWDSGNNSKSDIKHGVTMQEAESLFADNDKIFSDDTLHSFVEKRYICIGRSDMDRLLMCVFTMRADSIRIISTRPANKTERNAYHKKQG